MYPQGLLNVLALAVSRPYRLFFGQAVILFSSLRAYLIYAILFLLFTTYPYIFQGIHGMSYSISGLAFLPMDVGVLFSYVLVVQWNNYFARSLTSLFWLAWISSPNNYWIVPMLCEFLFAISLMVILVSIFNYLTDPYGSFSASALGAASCVKSIWGALLPQAAHSMYNRLWT